MFSPQERDHIRNHILEVAQKDTRIGSGAITGSLTLNNEDTWSDIDLAFGIKYKEQIMNVLNDFTSIMYEKFNSLHHLDVLSETWIYRVFLLSNTLQVDIALAPQEDFGAKAPSFKLVFGDSNSLPLVKPPNAEELIGKTWLYALHVRSSLARKNFWQSEFFLSAMRDMIISLACLRHDLPSTQGRGVDKLPIAFKFKLESSLLKSLSPKDLSNSFTLLVDLFLHEVNHENKDLNSKISTALTSLSKQIEVLSEQL